MCLLHDTLSIPTAHIFLPYLSVSACYFYSFVILFIPLPPSSCVTIWGVTNPLCSSCPNVRLGMGFRYSRVLFTFMWPCIVTNFFLIKPTDALISQIYFCQETTCFGQFLCPSSGVFHCTFGTGVCHQTCMTYTSAECTVENSWWWAEELPETCSFLTKINLGNQCVCWFY